MPTTTMMKPKDALYVALGAADTAFEKAKNLAGEAKSFVDKNRTPRTFVEATTNDLRSFVTKRTEALQKQVTTRRKDASKRFNRLAKRGEKLLSRIRRQAATQRTTDQARAARQQVKRTAKTVGKTASSAVEATVAAAQKVG